MPELEMLPVMEHEIQVLPSLPESTDTLGIEPPAPEQVFSHVHGDGREFSGTLEQARGVCPALGRMSLEDARITLGQSDLAAQVAQRGRERRLAEAKASESRVKAEKPTNVDVVRVTQATSTIAIDRRLEKELETAPAPRAETARNAANVIITEVLIKDKEHHEPEAEAVAATVAAMSKPVKAKPARPLEDKRKTIEVLESVSPLAVEPVQQAKLPRMQRTKTPVRTIEQLPHAPTLTKTKEVAEQSRISLPVQETVTPETTHKAVQPQEEQEEFEFPVIGAIEDIAHELVPYQEDEAEAGVETVPLPFVRPDVVMITELEPDNSVMAEDEVQIKIPTFSVMPTPELIELSESAVVVPELPAPVAEVEAALTELTEVFEQAEAEKTDEIYQIVEKMITLPDRIDVDIQTMEEKSEIIEQELEGLFVELFDAAGIEYTPELVESFVRLTQTHYLEQFFAAVKTDKEAKGLPDEIGTREFLQKLQNGLRAIQQTVAHIYEIGRSVLWLYLGRTAPHIAAT